VRPVLPAKEKFSPFFAFLAKTRLIPPFGNPRAFQPHKQNIDIFLFIFVSIDSQHILFDALSIIILKAAMSASLTFPSASAGDRRRRLPLSTSLLLPPLPPQSPPLSACCRYHRHCCRYCSVSAATACCCHQCCRCCCRCCSHHRRCCFSF